MVDSWCELNRFAERVDNKRGETADRPPLVIDLSALWAGPLCGSLLRQAGARVIKVESASRPDGARYGRRPFFDLLNADKESVVLDFGRREDIEFLRRLLLHADVVIESSRPRALEQLGIDLREFVSVVPGQVWVSITGYGRTGEERDWIAYGDDAGVAAGLAWAVRGDTNDPVFCADAIADPLTGLHATVAALACLHAGGGVHVSLALRDVAAFCANFGSGESGKYTAAKTRARSFVRRPSARRAAGVSPSLGRDTQRVFTEFAALPCARSVA